MRFQKGNKINLGKYHSEEAKRKMRENHKGMLNKHHTEETKRKISEAQKGIYKDDQWRRNLSEALKGRKHTEETKRKISETLKGHISKFWLGKKFSEEHKRKLSEAHKGKKSYIMTDEIKRKISEAKKGSKSSNWKGGISPINKQIRKSLQYKQWHQSIFLRDDFTCQKCKQRGGNLHAHHKKKSFSKLLEEVSQNLPLLGLFEGAMVYTPFWDIDNGISVCIVCHKKLHLKKGGKNK